MTRYFYGCFLAFIIISCNGNKQGSQPSSVDTSRKDSTQAAKLYAPPSIEYVRGWVGKYPSDVNMFGDSVLRQRMLKLLKGEYELFKTNWNVQTPFVEDSSIVSTSGCKQHDCPSYHSIIYFDVVNNQINIAILKDKQYKLFTEMDTIVLPASMKKDYEIIRGNL